MPIGNIQYSKDCISIAYAKTGDTFMLPAFCKIQSIVSYKRLPTVNSCLSIGENHHHIGYVIITTGSDADGGTITITLNGTGYATTVVGNLSIEQVVDALLQRSYGPYIAEKLSENTLMFTHTLITASSGCAFAGGTSGVTATAGDYQTGGIKTTTVVNNEALPNTAMSILQHTLQKSLFWRETQCQISLTLVTDVHIIINFIEFKHQTLIK